MTHSNSPIRKIANDKFQNLLRDEEKELLVILPELVEEAIRMNSPYVSRLFPPTYPFDDAAQTMVENCTSQSLIEDHKALLSGFSHTLYKKTLTFEDLAIWVGAINNIRLLLGTALDVCEEMELPDESDARFGDFVIYNYLAWLQSSLLDFLSDQDFSGT